MNDEQRKCEHDIAWDVTDGLDGMCRKCKLYVMKPNCIEETARWWTQQFGEGSWESAHD